jgi:hypothetical protein
MSEQTFWRETWRLTLDYLAAAACCVPSGILYAVFQPGIFGTVMLMCAAFAFMEARVIWVQDRRKMRDRS